MSKVSVELLRFRLAEIEARKAHYERRAAAKGGAFARHEMWRHHYLSHPYLIGAPDERVAARFRDIFINTTELGNEGKIGVSPFQVDDSIHQNFTHMLEEYEVRGGVPVDAVQSAREPILRYFDCGDPIAVKMFSGYEAPSSSFLVKYGARQFLEPMLRNGLIRICPASYYNDDKLLESVKDNEMQRIFFIPTFRERLSGRDFIEFQGHKIHFGDDDIEIPFMIDDYYLFSLCDHIYYRLPTDFNADAALIIRDPIRFSQRVISTFLANWPRWEPMYGKVTYYDPYRDHKKVRVPEMSKHFGYAYQREVRIAFRAKQQVSATLQPEYLNIGSMADYAELICA